MDWVSNFLDSMDGYGHEHGRGHQHGYGALSKYLANTIFGEMVLHCKDNQQGHNFVAGTTSVVAQLHVKRKTQQAAPMRASESVRTGVEEGNGAHLVSSRSPRHRPAGQCLCFKVPNKPSLVSERPKNLEVF